MLPFFGDNEFFGCSSCEIYFEDGLHNLIYVVARALLLFARSNLMLLGGCFAKRARNDVDIYIISSVASFATRTKSNTVGTLRIMYPMLPCTLSFMVIMAVMGFILPFKTAVMLV